MPVASRRLAFTGRPILPAWHLSLRRPKCPGELLLHGDLVEYVQQREDVPAFDIVLCEPHPQAAGDNRAVAYVAG